MRRKTSHMALTVQPCKLRCSDPGASAGTFRKGIELSYSRMILGTPKEVRWVIVR